MVLCKCQGLVQRGLTGRAMEGCERCRRVSWCRMRVKSSSQVCGRSRLRMAADEDLQLRSTLVAPAGEAVQDESVLRIVKRQRHGGRQAVAWLDKRARRGRSRSAKGVAGGASVVTSSLQPRYVVCLSDAHGADVLQRCKKRQAVRDVKRTE